MVWIQIRTNVLSVLIRVHTVCKDCQQMTKVTASIEGVKKTTYLYALYIHVLFLFNREHSCSVVGCLTRDRGVADSRLKGGTVLCP